MLHKSIHMLFARRFELDKSRQRIPVSSFQTTHPISSICWSSVSHIEPMSSILPEIPRHPPQRELDIELVDSRPIAVELDSKQLAAELDFLEPYQLP